MPDKLSITPKRLATAALLLALAPVARADVPARRPAATGAYMTLAPIDLPLIDGGTIGGRMIATLAVQAPDADTLAKVRTDQARFRTDLILRLSGFNRSEVTPWSPVEVDRLSHALNDRSQYRILVTNIHTTAR